MRSMTGHGRGESARDGLNITVELSSVNRRQGEIAVSLPRELDALEAPLREAILRQVSRGRVSARVTVQAAEGALGTGVKVNTALAKAYARELARLAKELHLESPVTLDMLVRAPGVLQTADALADAQQVWPVLEQALEPALAKLVQMRQREGAHLARDLKARVAVMRKAVARIQKQAPAVAVRYRDQLHERIRTAGIELPQRGDDERLLKEVALFADRSDISEELTRLQSHFQQFEDCLQSPEPVGRTLDFLAQEMNREINTIGSKANDALIAREVVLLKTELERFREQAQNVE